MMNVRIYKELVSGTIIVNIFIRGFHLQCFSMLVITRVSVFQFRLHLMAMINEESKKKEIKDK